MKTLLRWKQWSSDCHWNDNVIPSIIHSSYCMPFAY